ncbi:hypothetical protein ABW19_dt0203930 [Dactylella cylindrospora]|nr:hypothetical protein ABW19_dt0203930 [Dactylella cylindrospora]
MSRAIDSLASKLPQPPPKPLTQRLRHKLPFAAHVPLHASLTYLLAICLFSISFLVFLNSALSFVVTDLFGVQDGVGSIVGTLGFVDELVAVFMVIFWGSLSDKIGTRLVAVCGYFLVGLALVLAVQVQTIYPGLLLARMLFSTGASATVVSVTAILPEISTLPPDLQRPSRADLDIPRHDSGDYSTLPDTSDPSSSSLNRNRGTSSNRSTGAASSSSTASTASTITLPPAPSRPPRRRPGSRSQQRKAARNVPKAITGKLSGFVGLSTGCGALIALVFFLPLPTKFAENKHMTRVEALKHTFYVVALVAWLVALAVFVGLRGGGVGGKTWEFWKSETFSKLWRSKGKAKDIAAGSDVENANQNGQPDERSALLPDAGSLRSESILSDGDDSTYGSQQQNSDSTPEAPGVSEADKSWGGALKSYFEGLWLALKAGGEDWRIGLGYLGGFVARSMSVGISLFIPLYVNQWMRARGMCPPVLPSDPDYKKACHEAYILAAMLTGTSQLFALIFAPIVGYFSDRYEPQYPLMATAVLGFVSCAAFSALQSLSVGADRSWAFLHCALMGIGEIGAIVSSLALIGDAVQGGPQSPSLQQIQANNAQTSQDQQAQKKPSRLAVKGSISGVYSLCGAAGILLLTQLGGWGADHVNSGFAFDLLAVFFSIEIALGCWLIFRVKNNIV